MKLNDFCLKILQEVKKGDSLIPEYLATEFVRFFGLPRIISLDRLKELAKSLGIINISPENLPMEFRAYHFGSNGNYEILYQGDNWVGSIEHSVLHEIYEIIEDTCEEICPDLKKLKGKLRELAADEFAAGVLMQTEDFLTGIHQLSFDVLKLRHEYHRSYSSIILRMKKVLTGRFSFFAAIYELGNPNNIHYNDLGILESQDEDIENFICRYLVKTNDIRTDRKRGRLLWGALPKKNDKVISNSIVWHVLKEQRSIYRERVVGFDFFGLKDMSIIARPVIWGTKISKVIIIGLSHKDKQFLSEQIKEVKPILMDEAFQII